MLPLELPKEQPLEPRRKLRPFAAQRPLASLEHFLRNHSIRVGGLNLTGLEAVSAPPTSWDDEDWAGWLRQVPRGRSALPRLVAAGWALADHGRDLVAVGPLAPAERALLYMLPLLRHLREHPHPAFGRGPIAVVLGDASLIAALKEALAPHGIDVADTFHGDNLAQRARLAGCWVAALNPGYFQNKASGKWAAAFSHVSFLAVDDLGLWAREEGPALRNLLGHLPPRDWGPSVVWMPRWDARAEPLLGAFAESPLTLRAAEGVFGARVAHEALRRSEVAARVAAHMHRHPERRVLIFADDVQGLHAQLARVDTQGRLSGAGRATTVLAPNRGGWSPGGQAFDVVVHADAPPSLDEYQRRLAACRVHAFALVTLDARSLQLDPRWLPFVPPEEWARLRGPKIEERDIVEHVYLSEKREGGPAGPEGDGEGESFQDDFSLGENGELVWDAGEEGVDEEFAVFSEAL